jgi:hypothetical protein
MLIHLTNLAIYIMAFAYYGLVGVGVWFLVNLLFVPTLMLIVFGFRTIFGEKR